MIKKNSPLSLFDNFPSHESVCLNYKAVFKKTSPYGFDDCQSLVSFFHCTPNNTLPIIWWDSYEWNALFPRIASIRMDEAREFKKDIAFYIGICNRLGIDIFTGKNIIIQKQDKQVRNIGHNSKQDHSIVALLVLKNKGQNDLIICHLLGITTSELEFIYSESKIKGFIDNQKNITPIGQAFLLELTKKTRKENFRNDSERNLTERKVLYLPEMFEGKR